MSIVTVKLAGLNLCYNDGDYTLEHILKHGAVVVDCPAKLDPVQDIDFRTFGDVLGNYHPLSLVISHLLKHEIDFRIIDVGANIGLFAAGAAFFLLRCGQKKDIYAFEPGDAYTALVETLKANQINSWAHSYNLALGDEKGTLVFHEFPGNSSAGSLLPEISSRAGDLLLTEKMVEVRTIDDFVSENGIVSNLLCKIDTEGNDIKVIRGARNTIRERIVPLFVEFTPALVCSYADPVAEIRALADDYLLITTGEKNRMIDDVQVFVASVSHYVDIVALPKKMPFVADLAGRIVASTLV